MVTNTLPFYALSLFGNEFFLFIIEGIRSLGAQQRYIMIHYIIPNMVGPIIVLFTVRIGRTILSSSIKLFRIRLAAVNS